MRTITFPSREAKARWLDNSASIDATSPAIARLARMVASGSERPRWWVESIAHELELAARRSITKAEHDALVRRLNYAPRDIHGGRPIHRVLERIHRWARDAIAYVGDPKDGDGARHEEFADSETIIRRGFDDCDGKSRLFVALVRALRLPGVEARIRPVWNQQREFVHVQTEVRWPGCGHLGGPDGWVLGEMILAGVDLGDDPMRTGRRDDAGKWVLAGPSLPEDAARALI